MIIVNLWTSKVLTRPRDEMYLCRYDHATSLTRRSRWRFPSLSILSIDTTNSDKSYSVIPRSVTAKVRADSCWKLISLQISVRFVPDQKAERLVSIMQAHIDNEFAKRRSPNKVPVISSYILIDPAA